MFVISEYFSNQSHLLKISKNSLTHFSKTNIFNTSRKNILDFSKRTLFKISNRNQYKFAETQSKQNIFIKSWKNYEIFLREHPFKAQTLNTSLLMLVGDFLAQLIEGGLSAGVDYARLLRYAGVGMLMAGPGMHLWYSFIDRRLRNLFPGRIPLALVMTAADQIFFLPVYLAVFLVTMATLRGETYSQTKSRFRENFQPMLIDSYKLWPAVQVINFLWIPLRHRVLVINVVCLVWNTYISLNSEASSSTRNTELVI